MFNNTQLLNFERYLASCPKKYLGVPRDVLGAYDAAHGAAAHGFRRGIPNRDFARGGAFDAEGAKSRGGERYAGGEGERNSRGMGERDEGGADRPAKDDEQTELAVREWANSKGLSVRECDELLALLGITEAGEDLGEAQLRRNREQLDDHNAMDGRRVRPADAAARAAFDKANGITARRPRLLG